ncbi:MAG: hypothetical protein M3273_00490 [Actinomycetota bacterium]|nr:hypothetical protein [Actinomycetota bacterium]
MRSYVTVLALLDRNERVAGLSAAPPNQVWVKRFVTILLVLLVGLQPLALLRAAGAADAGTYEIPVWFRWDTTVLDVLIVPPNHGQVYNGNGPLNGGDPGEVTPFNSYLEAIEASVADWDRAVEMFADDWLKAAFVTNVYVLGRDVPPPSALSDPEIVIMTDETKANILGISFSTDPCISDNSKFFVTSFTYEDMYNVNAHEYGHCLGLDHVVNANPPHDTMAATYVDRVGAKGNHLHCVSSLDVEGLEAALGSAAGQASPASAFIPVEQYGTTCAPPQAAAPAPAPPSPAPSEPSSSPTSPPSSEPTASPSPSPSPTSTPSAQPTPSPTATPTPAATSSPTPEPTPPPPEEHARTVTLKLRRHLVARGRVAAVDGFADCEVAAEVDVSRRKSGQWTLVAQTATDSSGSFRVTLPDIRGRYRAEVAEVTTGGHTCASAVSVARRHRHS